MFSLVFVCLPAVQDYSKMRAWIGMKCCVSTDVGTWTNLLFFSQIRIIVLMPGPDCFLRYRMRCNAEFYYVGKIPRIGVGRPWLQRCVVLKWFLSRISILTRDIDIANLSVRLSVCPSRSGIR